MTRKLCTAGVRGPYSYVILDSSDVVVADLHTDHKNIVTTHMDMDIAEKWVDNQIQYLLGNRYETD